MLLLLVTGQTRGQTIGQTIPSKLNNMIENGDSYVLIYNKRHQHLKQSQPGKNNPIITLKAFIENNKFCVYSYNFEGINI
jgi:hypothetical protein